MNVLEKILEEIDEEQNGYEADHAWNYSKGLEYAKKSSVPIWMKFRIIMPDRFQ